MSRDTFSYTHGSRGQKPNSLNFEDGDYPNPEHFDWFWDLVVKSINGHAEEFNRLDSDNDSVVDEADWARDGNASTYKGNDIDSNGSGTVDDAEAVNGVTASTLERRGGRITLPAKRLDVGDAIVIGRYPDLPNGSSLAVQRSVISSDQMATPNGLAVRILDGSESEIASFEGGNYDMDEVYEVGGTNVLIVADNGHFGNGTGGYQTDVTAEIAIDIQL